MSDDEDVPSDYYDSDDGILDDDDSDFGTPIDKGKNKEERHAIAYESLSASKLQDTLDQDLRHVASIVGLETKTPIVSILLQHFRWSHDRLLEEYMDSASRVLQQAGEPPNPTPPSSPVVRPNKRARRDDARFECAICCDVDPENVFRPRCGHAFCKACWETYTTSKIRNEGQCFFRCMQDGCQTVVDEPTISELVDSACFERYRELLLQSYVSAHPHLRFCPHPSCTETISCTEGAGSTLLTKVPTVQCGQGHVFCFGCGLDSDHRPLNCKLVSKWVSSARNDAGTAQWIKANTRTCPHCQKPIEKSGGCNRILCRHCSYQFCWLCMKNWDVHGYNNAVCNVWKEPDPDEDMTTAKANLERWLFYFDRFNNHELSTRLDNELCERAAEKMDDVLKTHQMSWIEAKFMQNAVDELTKCRATLKWTYAMAYFMVPGNQKHIFEDIQADLEKAVEELSQLLEEPVEEDTVKALRQRMMDKTVYVRQRHEVVLHDTADGLAEGRWEWTVSIE
ncbi:hypothetical protein CERSUDRAFT_117213 [Gelatoporia subvermispora B]|uniref:RBR-type E3 ubiquitin transferase n=1 Tax=Ceriporiopsis subvermispora (strain B) TaxID=914234 RepID=M2QQ87_CERS8|nr:hypothetical protein CERSUDRAFT_117213 [Gelatoporia subvermispora B]